MSPEIKAKFIKKVNEGVKANYKYVWGGYDPTVFTYDRKKKIWAKGLDCSGFMFWGLDEIANRAAREAGINYLRRVTSSDMARGLGGWVGFDHPGSKSDDWLRNADEGDLVFFFDDYSHVGALLRHHATGMPGVAHASSSRGTVVDEIKGPSVWPERDFSKIRRLTIGEKK